MNKICVCQIEMQPRLGPMGSVDLCTSRYIMAAKTQTRVSGMFKPPFRDLVTLRTGFVWPRLLFSLECPFFSSSFLRTIHATFRRAIPIALPCFDRWWICIEGARLKRKSSRCRRSCPCFLHRRIISLIYHSPIINTDDRRNGIINCVQNTLA